MLRTWRRYTAVTCLAAAAACGGDGSTDPNEPGPMTARIDGDRFVAIQTTVLESGGITAVNGGSADLRAIGFQIQNLSTGTFTIAPGNLVSAGVTIGNAAWAPAATWVAERSRSPSSPPIESREPSSSPLMPSAAVRPEP